MSRWINADTTAWSCHPDHGKLLLHVQKNKGIDAIKAGNVIIPCLNPVVTGLIRIIYYKNYNKGSSL
jgi:hypothetical protein